MKSSFTVFALIVLVLLSYGLYQGLEAAPTARTMGEVQRIFTGWMFAESPWLHAVEHPVYDVWLTSCKTSAPPTPAPSNENSAEAPAPAPPPPAPAPGPAPAPSAPSKSR